MRLVPAPNLRLSSPHRRSPYRHAHNDADQEVKSMRPSRREFVKWVTASGIALSLSRLASAEEPTFTARETLPGRQNWNPAANGAGRIDGVAKVTGAKLYASDFHAADLPGWPSKTA